MPNQVLTITVREVVERTFVIDEAAMCDVMLWPPDVDDGEIREVVEHSDSWDAEGATTLSWLTEQTPADGWREAIDVRYVGPPSAAATSRNEASS